MADDDVIGLLLEQHAQIEELFLTIMDAEGDARREHFEELVRLLSAHETAEEEVVHPRGRDGAHVGDEVIKARLAEEKEAKQMLADLYRLGPDDPDFLPRLMTLRDAVLAHAKREERYEFPYLRQNLERRDRERMATVVMAAERFAPTRPHPGMESATANLLAGPPAAMVDRVRDALRDAIRERERERER